MGPDVANAKLVQFLIANAEMVHLPKTRIDALLDDDVHSSAMSDPADDRSDQMG